MNVFYGKGLIKSPELTHPRRKLSAALAVVALLVTLAFTGCSGNNPTDDIIVDAVDLTPLVTPPVKNTAPDTRAIKETQYTGTIKWQTSDGSDVSGNFGAATVYKAIVTLTAKEGYTLTGIEADKFTYSGQGVTVTNSADSGIVTITFPATAAEGQNTIVNALVLNSFITAPVKGAAPKTIPIDGLQYTGTIQWRTNAGDAVTGNFAVSTVYKAIVTLTVKSGFTFTGLAAKSFIYSGATEVDNSADSGIVTITFPATAGEGGSKTLTLTDIPEQGQGWYYLVFLLDDDYDAVAGFQGGPIKGTSISGTLKVLTVDGEKFTLGANWTGSGSYYTGILLSEKSISGTNMDTENITQLINPDLINFNGNVSVSINKFESGGSDREITITGIPQEYRNFNYSHIYFFEEIPASGLYNGDIFTVWGNQNNGNISGHLNGRGNLKDVPYYVVVTFVNGWGTSLEAATFKTSNKITIPDTDTFGWNASNFTRINGTGGTVTLSGTAGLKVDGTSYPNQQLIGEASPNGGASVINQTLNNGAWTATVDKNFFLVSFRIRAPTGGSDLRMEKTVIINGQGSTNLALGTLDRITLNGTVGTLTLNGSPITPDDYNIEISIANADMGWVKLQNNGADPNGWKTWTLYAPPQTQPKAVTFQVYIQSNVDNKSYWKRVTVNPPVTVSTTTVTGITINAALTDDDLDD
jgi:hypothetical protein